MSVYQANSTDLWSLIEQVLTTLEHARFKDHLRFNDHAALQAAHNQDDQRQAHMLTAATLALQKLVDLTKILDMKPKKGESAEEFLDRFKDVYGNQSGDLNYAGGNATPQFWAMLMNCLPLAVAQSIKTNNMDCMEATLSRMSRVVYAEFCANWKNRTTMGTSSWDAVGWGVLSLLTF